MAASKDYRFVPVAAQMAGAMCNAFFSAQGISTIKDDQGLAQHVWDVYRIFLETVWRDLDNAVALPGIADAVSAAEAAPSVAANPLPALPALVSAILSGLQSANVIPAAAPIAAIASSILGVLSSPPLAPLSSPASSSATTAAPVTAAK